MAIKYKDVYNTEDFGKRVNALTSEIAILGSSSFVSDGKKQMQDTIKRLKIKQEALFNTLGVKDISDLKFKTLEELYSLK